MNFIKTIVRIISIVTLVCFSALAVSAQDFLKKLVTANNSFAFDLLKQIAKEQTNGNIFISPFSVSTALQMVGNGAAGETKVEMQRVLKTGNWPPETLNATCKKLSQSLKSQKDVILDLADGIWYQNNFELKPDFVAADKEFFGAELAPVDFESPKSADVINDWADKETRGKIKGVVSFPFPPLTRVVLANAIYFKGKWDEPFDKNLTKPRDFHLANDDSKKVPMMQRGGKFDYQETGDFQAVQLPYAGGNLEMILFLPATNSNPQQLLADFSGKNWSEKILPQFSNREGTVVFPKFKLDYNITLNNSLKALGMRQAFDFPGADFSAMSDEPLFVSEVKQKSFVAVDEEGTEAAAVTTVALSDEALPLAPPKLFEMIVDRPFFFVIVDDSILITGDNPAQAILFMGIVNDPTP